MDLNAFPDNIDCEKEWTIFLHIHNLIISNYKIEYIHSFDISQLNS